MLYVTFTSFGCVCHRTMNFLWLVGMDSLTQKTLETKNIIVQGQTLPKLVKITYNITWPWISKSSVKVTHLWLVGMDSLTQKTLQTKQNSIVLGQTQPKLVKVTYNITWPCVSWSSVKVTHLWLLKWIPWSKNIRNKKNPSFLDKHSQKLVNVTYNITWPCVSRSSVKVTHLWLNGMDSLAQKHLKQKNHRSRTNTAKVSKVTWPWISKSSVKVTHLWLVGMDSLTRKPLETKTKFNRFRTNTAKVSEVHVQNHVTLRFKVIREGHAFVTSWNGFPDP